MKAIHKDEFREQARKHAKWAIADLAKAFNHCHNPTIGYRYSAEVQQRFIELAAELKDLVETGAIVGRPTANAQADHQFQRHIMALAGDLRIERKNTAA